MSLFIQEEETSNGSVIKSMDSLSCYKGNGEPPEVKVNGVTSRDGDNLQPEVLGGTGSRTTLNTTDDGPESLGIDNEEQRLHRDASTREADPSGQVFQRGKVCYGIYLPSLSGRLQDPKLEDAYQKYAHRQRQKSLILVNFLDLPLKLIVLVKVICLVKDTGPNLDEKCYFNEIQQNMPYIVFLTFAMMLNLFLGLVSWWRCYANNYLHWGALATWLLLYIQVC